MIDEEILAKLIADKTGMPRKEAQTKLDELAASIQKTVNAGETFSVEHFGIFKKEKDTAVFLPDEILQKEINQKYAGYQPIELVGSFKETAEALSVEAIQRPGESKPEGKKPLQELPQNDSKAESEPNKVLADSDISEGQTDKELAPQTEDAENEEAEYYYAYDEESRTKRVILIIAAIIAVLLLAGWLMYSMGVFSVDKTQKPASKNNISAALNDDTVQEADVLENSGNISLKVDEDNEALNESPFGLKGVVQPEGKNGYTIIIHSFWRENKALEVFSAVKQKGYRTMMIKANVDGRRYWRIGIGQFETIGDALQAAKTLPEPYKSNNFIKHQ